MSLVTDGVNGDTAPVRHMGRPTVERRLLHPVHVEFVEKLAANLAYHLEIGKTLRTKVNAAEELPVDVPIELFHEPTVGTASIMLEEHQYQFAFGWKMKNFAGNRGFFVSYDREF